MTVSRREFRTTPDGVSYVPFRRTIVYGPVNSRRLGRSLGINLLPPGTRTCSFACDYCFFLPHSPVTSRSASLLNGYPSVVQVQKAVRKKLAALAQQGTPPDAITFSGNGEPTLHPQFLEICYRVRDLRDRYCPGARLALLTNGTELPRPEVSSAVASLDEVFLKVDLGGDGAFLRHNRPAAGVRRDSILRAAAALPRPVHIQTAVSARDFLSDGSVPHLDAYLEGVTIASPCAIELYNLEYPAPALRKDISASSKQMAALGDELRRRLGVPVFALSGRNPRRELRPLAPLGRDWLRISRLPTLECVREVGEVLLTQHEPPPTDHDAFELLVSSEWIRPMGRGQFVFSGFGARLLRLFQRLVTKEAEELGFEEWVSPRVLRREACERFGLLRTWPHYLLSVSGFGDWQDKAWPVDGQGEYFLDPVQCLPVYSVLADREIPRSLLPLRVIEVGGGFSYRNETASKLEGILKAVSFLRAEMVFIGRPEEVRAIRAQLVVSVLGVLAQLGLASRLVVGSGCYEEACEEQTSAEELRRVARCPNELPIVDIQAFDPRTRQWWEIAGAATLSEFKTAPFQIRTAGEQRLQSGCVGVGIQRLLHLFVAQWGVDPGRWPSGVRETLLLGDAAR
jgi:wyosine [tRNA(Phe)-imidazoG37] synthetase (radical SAM superfamily)/seryl-tRNA synthetase